MTFSWAIVLVGLAWAFVWRQVKMTKEKNNERHRDRADQRMAER
jgi:hypothetical protein